MKVDEQASCPYCGHIDWYVFHLGSDSLYCNKCDKEFAIKSKVQTVILSDAFYTKQCYTCHTKFTSIQVKENGVCHKCGTELFDVDYEHDSPVYDK